MVEEATVAAVTKPKPSPEEQALIKAVQGLVEIARIAMPDTYFQSDSRMNRARKVLKKYGINVDTEET